MAPRKEFEKEERKPPSKRNWQPKPDRGDDQPDERKPGPPKRGDDQPRVRKPGAPKRPDDVVWDWEDDDLDADETIVEDDTDAEDADQDDVVWDDDDR